MFLLAVKLVEVCPKAFTRAEIAATARITASRSNIWTMLEDKSRVCHPPCPPPSFPPGPMWHHHVLTVSLSSAAAVITANVGLVCTVCAVHCTHCLLDARCRAGTSFIPTRIRSGNGDITDCKRLNRSSNNKIFIHSRDAYNNW